METGRNQRKYQGIPQTPPPRKHGLDSHLTIVQNKLELAMQALVTSQEANAREPVAQAAAWVRSAWEDIQQQRRHILQRQALDRWADNPTTTLLSQAEEKDVRTTTCVPTRYMPAGQKFWSEHQIPSQGARKPQEVPSHKGKREGKGNGKRL